MAGEHGMPDGVEQARAFRRAWRLSRAQWMAMLVGLAVGGGLAWLYRLYLQSSDVAPDSATGYGFAIAGTLVLLLVGGSYAARKRFGRRRPGRLHALLAWHMVGGLIGLALILMHAAGNFNPRTGTYALYGLIGVVVSGVMGRALDRLCPHLAAHAALQALAAGGEERLDALEGAHTGVRYPAARQPVPRGLPWDLAYYDLDPEIAEIAALLGQGSGGEILALDGSRRRSAAPRGPGTPGAPRPVVALPSRATSPETLCSPVASDVVRQATGWSAALGREQCCIDLVRVWRRLHTLISLVALGLVLWHLEYAATLLVGH